MFSKKIINKQIFCYENIPDHMKKLVIYCHGFGENKDRITQHLEILNIYNIGIIGFDFPCHGEDKQKYFYFNLTNCINYLDAVIEYSKKFDVPISLFGSSFGGYIILSRINRKNDRFDKVFLKFPAINFYECTKRKLKIDIDYYDNHNYYEFLNGRKMTKEAFIEFMNDDLMNNFSKHNNDIYVIHGDKDRTVLLSDVQSFCDKYNIKLEVIEGAEHGMKNYLDIVNQKLLSYIEK